MEVESQTEGLRERKRAALQATIEQTALDLMLERGYEDVTIDEICEASMISQRTFFNYFGAKEGVILGSTPPIPPAAAIKKFTMQGTENMLADYVVMVTAAFSGIEVDPAIFKSRWLLVQRTPELFDRQMARMAETEALMVEIVQERLRDESPRSDSSDLDDEAHMLVELGTGVMRFMMRKRITSDPRRSNQRLIDSSIELIKRITIDNENNQKAANV